MSIGLLVTKALFHLYYRQRGQKLFILGGNDAKIAMLGNQNLSGRANLGKNRMISEFF